MKPEEKLLCYIEAIKYFFMFIISQLVAEVIVVIVTLLPLASGMDMTFDELQPLMEKALLEQQYTIMLLSYVFVALMLVRQQRKLPVPLLAVPGFDGRSTPSAVLAAIALGGAGNLWVSILIDKFTPPPNPFDLIGAQAEAVAVPVTAVQLIVVLLLAPIIEELVFRGLIFSRFKLALPFIAALILQAIEYALLYDGLGLSFSMAIVFGIVVFWTGSIYPAIAAHIGFNAAGYAIDYFWGSISATQAAMKWSGSIAGIIICACLLIIYNKGKGSISDNKAA